MRTCLTSHFSLADAHPSWLHLAEQETFKRNKHETNIIYEYGGFLKMEVPLNHPCYFETFHEPCSYDLQTHPHLASGSKRITRLCPIYHLLNAYRFCIYIIPYTSICIYIYIYIWGWKDLEKYGIRSNHIHIPICSMYGIYANIGGILMGSMLPYIAYGSYGIYLVYSCLFHILLRIFFYAADRCHGQIIVFHNVWHVIPCHGNQLHNGCINPYELPSGKLT